MGKAISERQRRQEGQGTVGRDRCHLTSRWLRKISGHTMTCYLCQEGGQRSSPWRFSDLLVDLAHSPYIRPSQALARSVSTFVA